MEVEDKKKNKNKSRHQSGFSWNWKLQVKAAANDNKDVMIDLWTTCNEIWVTCHTNTDRVGVIFVAHAPSTGITS
jgi:hypothetical protein